MMHVIKRWCFECSGSGRSRAPLEIDCATCEGAGFYFYDAQDDSFGHVITRSKLPAGSVVVSFTGPTAWVDNERRKSYRERPPSR